MKRILSVVLLALAVVGLTPPAAAQCPGNDGFSAAGACCLPAMGALPAFPTITLNGLGACVRDCGVESQFNTLATLAPTQLLCDYWAFGVTIISTSGPGVTVTTPLLVAKYARTWLEHTIPGIPPTQVWRFLVNGDFNYAASTAATPGCPVPLSALPPYNLPVHFIGHVDYALNCATGSWEVAYSLTHFCPTEAHANFSARHIPAASGWAKRTYHFVGPANFVFGICPPPSGAIVAESARTSVGLTTPVPYTCLHETQILTGSLSDVFQNCTCFDPTPIGPPPRYTHQNLASAEGCAGAVAPVASFAGFGLPFLPTGLRAQAIGSWVPVAALSYPGNECVSVYLGVLNAPGLCPPLPPPLGPLHAVTGVGTTGGHPVTLFDQPTPAILPLEFLDLENMLVLTPVGFVPGMGALFGSERVWSFNTL